ncbi:MAG: AIR synthase related protein [Alphaproteobacteria bacterium]
MSLEILKKMLQTPDLASKKWLFEQYDSQVMNDTIAINGDASLVRVHGTQKALALTVDCTPRYVEADPFHGSIQAVAETYRNISATGAKPLAITNCLNFGNPQKPEIMGQIVKSIQGITQACKALDYPVVSGNVSLYNETNGHAIQPTPAIGGVGLLKDLTKRCDIKFKNLGDEIFVIGKTNGHMNCTLFEREILDVDDKKNPPQVNLIDEKKNADFIRDLIDQSLINACHDVSDGGILISLFEMSSLEYGCKIDLSNLKTANSLSDEEILFSEDQSRYIIASNPKLSKELFKKADKAGVFIAKIATVIEKKLTFNDLSEDITDLVKTNELLFEKNFS